MPQYSDDLIKSILRSTKIFAMVGASANEMRPSYFAMKYLLDKGFLVRPVNPGLAGKQILGQTVYAALGGVEEALAEKDRLGLKTVWMQLGVINEEAAAKAREAGLTVIMDRCPKIEYGRLSGEIGWMGVNRRVIDNRKPLLFGKGGSLKRV